MKTTTRTEADTAAADAPATCQVVEGTLHGDKACTAPGHHILINGGVYSVCCGHRVLLEAAGMTDGWAEL